MSSESDSIDATQSLRKSAELARTCAILRNSYLQSKREELLETYEQYKALDKMNDKPDRDAVLLGFREDWMKREYVDIQAVGDLLDDSFFIDNRAAGAFYTASIKLSQER